MKPKLPNQLKLVQSIRSSRSYHVSLRPLINPPLNYDPVDFPADPISTNPTIEQAEISKQAPLGNAFEASGDANQPKKTNASTKQQQGGQSKMNIFSPKQETGSGGGEQSLRGKIKKFFGWMYTESNVPTEKTLHDEKERDMSSADRTDFPQHEEETKR